MISAASSDRRIEVAYFHLKEPSRSVIGYRPIEYLASDERTLGPLEIEPDVEGALAALGLEGN
jgi:hypothetical protein